MESKGALISEEKRDESGRFIVPPVSPGRPRGARSKLGEAFVGDLLADWEENGAQAIKDMREDKPGDYVKVVAAVLPKELNVKVSELDELSDEQLARQLASLVTQLARAGVEIGQGATEAVAPQQLN